MKKGSDFKTEKILVTVKTAPQPKISNSLPEVVCTAGFRENGELIRLYPVDYRHLKDNQKYEKYQWITCRIRKHPHDPRPETYEPDISTIVLHSIIGPENGSWKTRLNQISLKNINTTCELQRRLNEQNYSVSLGIVRPKKIHGFKIVKDTKLWSPGVIKAVSNGDLFNYRLPLKKIPYRFVYHYECEEESCAGHRMSLIDWEAYTLFHKSSREGEESAIANIEKKYRDQYLSGKYELYFYLGTASMHKSWMILGLIAPLKSKYNKDQSLMFEN